MDWSEGFHLTQSVGPNYLHGQLHADARTAIQFAHRLGALALGLVLLALAMRYWQEVRLRPWLGGLVSVFVAQVGLGIANVLMWLPLWLALLHTGGAVALVVMMTLAVWGWRESAPQLTQQSPVEKEWAHV